MSAMGYTVKYSIDAINDICNEPETYNKNVYQGAINDAYTHYHYGNTSKDWYDSVVRILSAYL